MYTIEFEELGKRIKSDGSYNFTIQTKLPVTEDNDRDEPSWSTDGHYPRLEMALRNLMDKEQLGLEGNPGLEDLVEAISQQNERLDRIARVQFYREFLIEELHLVSDAPSEEELEELPTEKLEGLFDRFVAPTWHRLSE